jgi:hypothetical protein
MVDFRGVRGCVFTSRFLGKAAGVKVLLAVSKPVATKRGLSARRFPPRSVKLLTRCPWARDKQIASDCDARTPVSEGVLS